MSNGAPQHHESHLQTIVSNIGEGIVILDSKHTVIFTNNTACRMFALTLPELLGSCLNLGTWENLQGEIEIWQEGLTPGIGEIQSKAIIWDDEPALLVSIRDVTARQAAVQKIYWSELRYQTLMAALPNMVWVLDTWGQVQDVNQYALDYLGLSRSAVKTSFWQEICHPQDQPRAQQNWRLGNHHLQSGQAEYRLRRADGIYRWHLVQMTPLDPATGGNVLWLISCTNIDDLKEAEILLQQQGKQQRLILSIGQRIRRSLDLKTILKTTVQEIRRTLKADRVLVYRTYDNGTGEAIAESVARGWVAVLNFDLPEEVFPLECYERYARGYIFSLFDRELGGTLECLTDFLREIQVRAKLVVPIVQGKKLWGLLIAHQCSSPRHWQTWEINLLQQLSLQLAIAIQQSYLYDQLAKELQRRKQAQTQLLEITRLQKAILQGASYPIISIDDAGLISTFNQAAEKLLGYTAEEVLHRHTPLLFHDPQEIQACAQELSQACGYVVPADMTVFTLPARQGISPEREWTYITKNGDRIPVLLSVTCLLDDGEDAVGFVGIAQDLRERKRLESERQTLDAVVKNSSEFIAITHPNQRLIFLNQAGCALVGISSLTAALQTSILDYHLPEDRPQMEEEIFPILQEGGRWEGELRLCHQVTGKPIPVLVNTFVIKDQRGQNLFWVAIMRDISQLKQAQQEILQALEKEKELSELRSRFISMASHEFRTPLAIIGSSTGILELYYQKLSEDKRQQHLHRIQNSVRHMTELLDDVLLVNRAEADRLAFNPLEGNLQEFCQKLVAEIQLGTTEQEIILTTQDLGQPLLQDWDGVFDPKLLRQILTNLLSNAIKYSPPQTQIHLTVERQGQQAVFIVADQGMGIPPEDLSRLFTAFHRAHNVGTIQGTGLGLAIVKKCTTLHQGEITVTSELGQGTCFTLKLPCFTPTSSDLSE